MTDPARPCRPRILICSNAYPPDFVGGAELVAHDQAKALARQGHEVAVFAGDLGLNGERHRRHDTIHDGIRVHRIATVPEDYSPEFLNFHHPRIEAHFRDVLRSFNPTVVHCHNLMGLSVKLPMIAHAHGARTVCTLHDFWGFCPRNTAVRPDGGACWNDARCASCLPRVHDGRGLDLPARFRQDFMALALDHVDRFIAPSRFVAHRYARAGFAPERIVTLPNGIDTDRFRPAPERPAAGEVRLTFAGYFGTHKGVATLIDALALLPDPHVVLQLAGAGPEGDTYRARIDALGLGGQVRFLGKVSPADMPGVYAASDIVVLPSIWNENQPVCVMEAMASGLPVVATGLGGIPELVGHGETGLLFAVGDAADLAAQLRTLIAAPELRRAMGNEGRRRVERLSRDGQVARQVALYHAIPGPAQDPPDRRVFAVIGSRWKTDLAGYAPLADTRHRGIRFVPRAWIGDCITRFAGALFAGEAFGPFRRDKVLIAFPRGLRIIASMALRRIARRDDRASGDRSQS